MQSSFDDGRFNISFFASLSPWGWFSVLIGPEMKEPLLASHFDSIFSQSRRRDKSRVNCSSGISTPPSLPCRNPKFRPHAFSRFRRGSVLNCEVEFRMEEIKASLEIDILSLWFICPRQNGWSSRRKSSKSWTCPFSQFRTKGTERKKNCLHLPCTK